MITCVKWSKSQTQPEDEPVAPVEYIGVAVPGNPYISGRVTLVTGLENRFNDLPIASSRDAVELKARLGKQGLKFEKHCEIHIVECYEPVSAMFAIPEGSNPGDEELKAFLLKVVNTYVGSLERSFVVYSFAVPKTPSSEPVAQEEGEKELIRKKNLNL